MVSNLQRYRLASVKSDTYGYELLMFGQIPCPSADTNCWQPTDPKSSPSHYKVPFGRNQAISQLKWTSVLPKVLTNPVNGSYSACSGMMDLDMSSPVVELYEFIEGGSYPSAASFGTAYIDTFAHTDEVYLTSRSQGLVRYNPAIGSCKLASRFRETSSNGTSEPRNRTMSAILGLSLPVNYIYGGIDTSPNGTLSVSGELLELSTYANSWIMSADTAEHQIPPSYNGIMFVDTNNDPLEARAESLYMIGGCNTTATAFDPTDITGCQPMNTIYKFGIYGKVAKAAKVISVQGWIPPITKSFCSTFIQELGLFVSGGYQAPTVAGGPPTVNTDSWLLTSDRYSGVFTWQNVTMDNPKRLPSLPAVGHDCLFSAEQILFAGPSNSADGSGDPPPIFVVNIQRPATYNGPASFSRGSVLNQPIDFIYGHVPPPPSKKTWTIYIGIAAALVLLVLASVMIWRRRRNQRKLSPHLGEMKQ